MLNEFELVHEMIHRGATREELVAMFRYIACKDSNADCAISIASLEQKYGKISIDR